MASYSIADRVTSGAIPVTANSVLTVTAPQGTTAVLLYTKGSQVDVNNGVAQFTAWPRGNITSTSASDVVRFNGFVKLSSTGGTSTLDTNTNPSTTTSGQYTPDFASQDALINNQNKIIGPTGVAISGSGSSSVSKSTSLSRTIGNQITVQASSPNTNLYTMAKYEFDAPVRRMRLHFHNASPALVTRNIECAVAPTERGAIDTAANSFSAWQNGTTHNVLLSDAEPFGFKIFTWGANGLKSGVLQTTSQPQVEIGHTNQGLTGFSAAPNQIETVSTDWIEVQALPNVDMNNGRYYYIIRMSHQGIVDEGMSLAQWTANMQEYVDNPNQTRLMSWLGTGSGNGSNISNLTLIPGNAPTPANVTNGPYVTVEVDYGKPSLTIMGVGDSITESYKWFNRAVFLNSTNNLPITPVNCGASSQRSDSFLGNMYLHLQALTLPDFVLTQSVSVNNYSPGSGFGVRQAAFEVKRNRENVNYLRSRGIKPIYWTAYNFGADTTPGTAIAIVNDDIRAMAAAGLITLMEVNRDPRLNRSFYDASTNPTGFFGGVGTPNYPDTTHPGPEYGVPLMTSIAQATIAGVIV